MDNKPESSTSSQASHLARGCSCFCLWLHGPTPRVPTKDTPNVTRKAFIAACAECYKGLDLERTAHEGSKYQASSPKAPCPSSKENDQTLTCKNLRYVNESGSLWTSQPRETTGTKQLLSPKPICQEHSYLLAQDSREVLRGHLNSARAEAWERSWSYTQTKEIQFSTHCTQGFHHSSDVYMLVPT